MLSVLFGAFWLPPHHTRKMNPGALGCEAVLRSKSSVGKWLCWGVACTFGKHGYPCTRKVVSETRDVKQHLFSPMDEMIKRGMFRNISSWFMLGSDLHLRRFFERAVEYAALMAYINTFRPIYASGFTQMNNSRQLLL
jgi:hypothetical protein